MNPQLAGHETFYPRGNWLHKGLVAVQENPTLFSRAFPYPTDWLGVGVNMAKSIRHWLSVLSLIEPAEQGHIPTKFVTHLFKCGKPHSKIQILTSFRICLACPTVLFRLKN